MIDDLGELADALAGKAADALAKPLASFAQQLADPTGSSSRQGEVFSAIDEWVGAAARFCVSRDPQLDIAGALPKRNVVPLRFAPRKAVVTLAAD